MSNYQSTPQPLDKNGNAIGIEDILKICREDEAWRFKVLAVDHLHGSGSVHVECLDPVEPGFEKRWVSRYDLRRSYEIETKLSGN